MKKKKENEIEYFAYYFDCWISAAAWLRNVAMGNSTEAFLFNGVGEANNPNLGMTNCSRKKNAKGAANKGNAIANPVSYPSLSPAVSKMRNPKMGQITAKTHSSKPE